MQSQPLRHPKVCPFSSMLRLGKVISKTLEAPEIIEVAEFDLASMAWCPLTKQKYFVEKEPFAKGGFRSVYKAKHIQGKTFVIKKFLPETLKMIENVNTAVVDPESQETLCKKAVQMHMLAANLASQFKKHLPKDNGIAFGKTFSYQSAKFGKMVSNKQCVVIENFIPGEFYKYVNNDGLPCHNNNDCVLLQKAECLAHYSYAKSNGELMLLDIQGSSYALYDPEIATESPSDESGLKFCMGNLSMLAISNFKKNHECNHYCELAGLDKIVEST